jgi:hypothetical protein
MAAIRLATHLFGSRDGYRGLAHSPDLSLAERQELESFGFGETADASLLASLAETPSALGRPLPGGRVAFTRLFAGMPDDALRPTLELRSVVASPPDALAIARGGVDALLADPAVWWRGSFAAGREASFVPPSPRPPSGAGHLGVFEQWVRLDRPDGESGERPMLLLEPEPEGSAAIVELLARLSPEDLWSLRWGIRLLGSGGLCDLGTLAPGVRWRGDRPFRRIMAAGAEISPEFLQRLLGHPLAPALPPRREAAAWAGVPPPGRAKGRIAAAVWWGIAAVLVAVAALLWWPRGRGGEAEVAGRDAPVPAAVDEARGEVDATPVAAPAIRGFAAIGEGSGGGDPAKERGGEQPPAPPPPQQLIDAAIAAAADEPDDGHPSADAEPASDAEPQHPETMPPASTPPPQVEPPGDAAEAEIAIAPLDPCVEAERVRTLVVELAGEVASLLGRTPTRWERIDEAIAEIDRSLRGLGLADAGEEERRFVLQLLRDRRPPLPEAALLEWWPRIRPRLCAWQAWAEASSAIAAIQSRISARAPWRSLTQLRRSSLWVLGADASRGDALLERRRALLSGLALDARRLGQPPRFCLWLEEAAAGRLAEESLWRPPLDPQDPLDAAVR